MQNLRVLVVDDECLVADSLAEILRMFGYEALAAYSPGQALERIGSLPYDFVVSDVVMDGQMSGIDLAIELGELVPKCKVLLVSGNNCTAELLKAAANKGHVFDVLAKPVHPQVILEKLKAMTAETALDTH